MENIQKNKIRLQPLPVINYSIKYIEIYISKDGATIKFIVPSFFQTV